MTPTPVCHCAELRSETPTSFDWGELEQLDRKETYPGGNVDCYDYTLRCPVCGTVWTMELDHTPVFPTYKWSEEHPR